MKGLAFVAVALFSVTLALDLEALQLNAMKNRDGVNGAEKRRVLNPPYINMFRENQDENARMQDPQQFYRRMQEIWTNMASKENRPDPMWAEAAHREPKFRSMSEIRPPYDQAYAEVTPDQDSAFRWAPASAQRSGNFEKRHLQYRSHKQLPYSDRVPQDEEVVKKRSADKEVHMTDSDTEDEKKRNKRTIVAETVGSKNVNASENKMSPDQYKQWLTDEYYRNMAMSFATMRKRRSVGDQPGLDAPEVRDERSVLDRLGQMEQALMQDAAQQFLTVEGPSAGGKLRNQINEQRMDVAHDVQGLKKAIRTFYSDAQRLRALDEQQLMALLKEARMEDIKAATPPAGSNAEGQCAELQVLSSGCSALQGMFPPVSVQDQFLLSCNWHEVCYSCGSQHGVTADQCDQVFLQDMQAVCGQLGSCNKQMVALLLEPLHKKRVYFKRSALPICDRSCVVSFLARN